MAAFEPFEPAVKSGSAGSTILIQATAGGTGGIAVLDSTGGMNPTLMVTWQSAIGGPQYLRMSSESSTAIAVSSTDTPLGNPTGVAGAFDVRLFANPNPAGKTTFAVLVSITNST